MDRFFRTSLLVGDGGMKALRASHIAVFGIGGVGGFAAEALVRSGVGEISIVDFDRVDITNINRQLIATTTTVGEMKTEILAKRLMDINPSLKLYCFDRKYTPEDRFGLDNVDFVIDAIDIVTSKIDLLEQCYLRNIPVISSMGMGNRLDPTKIELVDLANTKNCPLAKVVRRELGKRGVKHIMTVCSSEDAIKPCISVSSDAKREIPGSCAFVPSVAGLTMASYVVRTIAMADSLV